MKVVLPLPPTTNNLYRHAYVKGKTVVYMTAEAKAWKEEAQWMLKKGRPTDKEVEVFVYFYLTRDRDCDNLKLLIDALENTKVNNDSQIVALHIFKERVKDKPHCEVEVNELI
jgi:Holliday junction resolvase RusA-like endonuclease